MLKKLRRAWLKMQETHLIARIEHIREVHGSENTRLYLEHRLAKVQSKLEKLEK